MLFEVINLVLYGALFLSLFLIDYALGNGFVEVFQKVLCKLVCFVRKTIREEANLLNVPESTVSLPVLCSEILFLGLTILILNRYKQYRGKDRIDELLRESREALRQTNEFLEKWRLRRLNSRAPSEHSYLDEEPQKLEPLKLEVPILHMAIIDTIGMTKYQPESGDTGDQVNTTDSTLLSVTSFLDEDLDSIEDIVAGEDYFGEPKTTDFNNRFLWDVLEEDMTNLDE